MRQRACVSLFCCLLLAVCAVPVAAGEVPLNEELIREAFAPSGDKAGDEVPWDDVTDPVDIRWERGSFSAPGAIEAVVSFTERRLAHLNDQLWLLKWDGKRWTPALMIDRADRVTFEVFDIATGGVSLVLVRLETGFMGGYRLMDLFLVSLVGGTVRALYSAEGEGFWCYNEWVNNGHRVPTIDHEVALTDVDGDGVLELVETRLSGVFVSTGTDEGDCEIHNTPIKTTRYRFVLDGDKNAVSVEEITGR